MIDIQQVGEESWELRVNGILIIRSSEEGVCRRYARICDHCRNIPYRHAIKTLIEDIGYREETAKWLYQQLFEYRNTGAVN